MKDNKLFVYSFYRFINIINKVALSIKLKQFCHDKKIKGTVLIADEGINGSISGNKIYLNTFIKILKHECNIRQLSLKINETNFIPFNKMKVKLKKEIVSFGNSNLSSHSNGKNKLIPSDWAKLISDKSVKLIDVRNKYEINIGKFKNSINPNTNYFREFPKAVKNFKIKKSDTIAMYCTGGIRCEKASNFLKKKGFKNVYELDGGILNFFEYFKNKETLNLYKGECFVFDDRVSVTKKLKKGKYDQCHGCRMPLLNSEKKSKYYVKGVQCPKCYMTRTPKQKKRSATRQRQIDLAEESKLDHPFKKLYR